MQFNCEKIRQKSQAKNLPKPFWVRNPRICPISVEQQEAIRRVVECFLQLQKLPVSKGNSQLLDEAETKRKATSHAEKGSKSVTPWFCVWISWWKLEGDVLAGALLCMCGGGAGFLCVHNSLEFDSLCLIGSLQCTISASTIPCLSFRCLLMGTVLNQSRTLFISHTSPDTEEMYSICQYAWTRLIQPAALAKRDLIKFDFLRDIWIRTQRDAIALST
jgi:hypothetical protein